MSEFDLFSRLAAGERSFDAPVCSRASCGQPAVTRIEWRNPRIHSPERIKIWLACNDHLGYLVGFLRDREFPVRTHDVTHEIDEEPIA